MGTITASKRIDLRAEKGTDPSTWGADSQEIERIASKATPKRDPWPQILQARQHILSLAETKAKNRGIRSLGVRTSYDAKEIDKGFAVIRLQFTGHSDDPEVERAVSMKIADQALGSSDRLYGPGAGARAFSPPPIVPRIATAEVIDDEPEPPNGCRQEEKKSEPAKAEPEHSMDEPPAEEAKAPQPPKEDPQLICGKQNPDGSWPRKPASQFSVEDLRQKIAYAEKSRSKWDPKWAAKNEAELAAVKNWLAFRELSSNQGQTAVKTDEVPY